MKRIVFTTIIFCLSAGFVITGAADLPITNPPSGPQAATAGNEVRRLLSQPPEKLAEMAKELGVRTLADLQTGRRQAQLEVREKSLVRERVDLLAQADEADASRLDVIERFEREIDRTRQQFEDDPAECNQQLVEVIAQYRPQIIRLKETADKRRQQASKSDEELKGLRSKLAALERNRRHAADVRLSAEFANRPAGHDVELDFEALDALGLDAETLGRERLGANRKPASPIINATSGVPSEKPVDAMIAELKQLK